MTGLPGLFHLPPISAAPVPSQMGCRSSPILKIRTRPQYHNIIAKVILRHGELPVRSWKHPAAYDLATGDATYVKKSLRHHPNSRHIARSHKFWPNVRRTPIPLRSAYHGDVYKL